MATLIVKDTDPYFEGITCSSHQPVDVLYVGLVVQQAYMVYSTLVKLVA